MNKVSYHTHSAVSDGEFSPRELIELAIEKGFSVLAITDHHPRLADASSNGWGAGFYTDEDYVELRKLQEEYKGRIEILVGVEFEWYSDHKDWLFGEIGKRDYDLKIISIHQIFIDGKYYTVNHTDELLNEAFVAFGGDIKKAVSFYYETLRDAAASGRFDIVGHLDLIKTFNEDSRYFSEEEDWYREEVIRTLEVVKEFGLKMEINLKGLARSPGGQWPSKWIIDEAKKMDIELLIGTDAHKESDLDYDVDVVERLLS